MVDGLELDNRQRLQHWPTALIASLQPPGINQYQNGEERYGHGRDCTPGTKALEDDELTVLEPDGEQKGGPYEPLQPPIGLR